MCMKYMTNRSTSKATRTDNLGHISRVVSSASAPALRPSAANYNASKASSLGGSEGNAVNVHSNLGQNFGFHP